MTQPAFPETKTDQLLKLIRARKWKDALKIASRFRLGLTREQRIILSRAYESYHYGYMQIQMKRDPEQCRQAGIELLKQLYGNRVA